MATWEKPPTEEDLANSFGPGQYTISVAQENIVGLRHHATITVPWLVESAHFVEGEPTIDYIIEHFGAGNYYLMKRPRDITPYQAYPTGTPHDWTLELLEEGVSAIKDIHILVKVNLPWL